MSPVIGFPDPRGAPVPVLPRNSEKLKTFMAEHTGKLMKFNFTYVGKVKSSGPSLRETREKRPLGRDPDRRWRYRHTSVKLFWSQPMVPWTLVAAHECAASQSMDPWAATKKAFHYRERKIRRNMLTTNPM